MNNNERIKLSDWLKLGHTDEEIRLAFFSMDCTMKYLHQKGYAIETFRPEEIEILNDSVDEIKYNTLVALDPSDRERVHNDIYRSAFLQVGIYTNCLNYMKPQFLKDNFDSFATFLPEGDEPYYRGIIERGASVYFSDFALEKEKRDYMALSEQTSLDAGGMGKAREYVKTMPGVDPVDASNVVGIMPGKLEVELNVINNANNKIYAKLNTGITGNVGFYLLIVAIVLLVFVVFMVILLVK
jgi:hypothetical protein